MTVYFLGGGNMAAAIVAGMAAEGDWQIHVANRGAEKRAQLAQQFGVAVSEKLPPLGADDILVLAVKPQDMQAALAGVQANGALVLSVAAGLSVATLSRYLGGTRRIIRIMPNTPGRIGLGVAGMFAADGANEADRQAADAIMRTNGSTVWLDDEAQMHAITGISGSGPAYVFYLLNALKEAAQAQGFDEATARSLAWPPLKAQWNWRRKAEKISPCCSKMSPPKAAPRTKPSKLLKHTAWLRPSVPVWRHVWRARSKWRNSLTLKTNRKGRLK